jgi:hypothetical protein
MNTGVKLPPIPAGADLVTAINDRLRRIEDLISGAATPAKPTTPPHGAGGGGLPTPTPGSSPTAPNVLASSSTYALTQVGTVPYFRPTGTSLTLPTTDANYSHLMKITIWLLDGAAPVGVAAQIDAPFSPDSLHNITWSGNLFSQLTIAKAYTLRFDCSREDGSVTPGAWTETLNVPAAIPLAPPITISGLPVGSEVGPTSIDLTNQLQHTLIRVTGTVSASAGNQLFSVWRSIDNGINFVGIATYSFSGTSFTTASVGDIDSLSPLTTSNWKVAVAIGYVPLIEGVSFPLANLPSNAVVSASFSVAGYPAPSASGASSLSFSNPVYVGINSLGAPYWKAVLTGNIAGAADPAAWVYSITVECVDVNGNSDPNLDLNTSVSTGICNTTTNTVTFVSGERFVPSLHSGTGLTITVNGRTYNPTSYVNSGHLTVVGVTAGLTNVPFSFTGGEKIFGEFVNSGTTIAPTANSSTLLIGNYNPTGSIYTYLRFKCYATNRAVTENPGWKDPTAVLQTTAWNGASSQTVSFGPNPGGSSGAFPVTNPGFETGDLSGWIQNNATAGHLASVVGSGTTAPHSGIYSAQCVGTTSGLTQTFQCLPGAIVTSSCWVKTDGVAADVFVMEMTFFAGVSTIGVVATTTLAATAAWTQFNNFGVSPAGATSVKFAFHRNTPAAGSWFLDDVTVGISGSGVSIAPGGFTQAGSGNQATSILLDWDFGLSTVGSIPSGGNSWLSYLNALIKNDNSGAGNYVRLTNAAAEVMQTRTISPGQAYYFSAQVRSNNVGAPHSVTLYVTWKDGYGNTISGPTAIATNSGFISAWTLGLIGWATAPAASNVAFVEVVVNNSETSTGYWDVGQIVMQPTMNQNSGSQTQSNVPTSGFSGSTIISGVKGAQSVALDPYSYYFLNAVFSAFLTTNGGVSFSLNKNTAPLGTFAIGIDASGNLIIQVQDAGGAITAGFTGAVAGRSAIHGIVV